MLQDNLLKPRLTVCTDYYRSFSKIFTSVSLDILVTFFPKHFFFYSTVKDLMSLGM